MNETDLLIINRGGVDYKVTVKDLQEYLTPSPFCITVTESQINYMDDSTDPVKMPRGGGYFYSVGYHPVIGWRAIGGNLQDNDAWWVLKPNDSGVLEDPWQWVDRIPGSYMKSWSNSQMAVIGDKLVAVMLDQNKHIWRCEISDTGVTGEDIGGVTSASDHYTMFSKTTYDAAAKTWLIHLTTHYTMEDANTGEFYYGTETYTYNEDKKRYSLLSDRTYFNGLPVLDQVTVDGSTIYITETGICDEAGNHTELWGAKFAPGEGIKPNNASIKYSPKLDQIVATVSKSRNGDPEDLFTDAKNLWVSNDKGKSWTVVDTEPDPNWQGEIVQWSGIDWIPDGINELGTKGLWVVQSLRGGSNQDAGHLHTLTSGDGINWKFEYGRTVETPFDGKYTIYDGKQYIVCGLGDDYEEGLAVGPKYCRMAFLSNTCSVTIPGIATVNDTTGLTDGQPFGNGTIIKVIDSTRFTFTGNVAVGDKICP